MGGSGRCRRLDPIGDVSVELLDRDRNPHCLEWGLLAEKGCCRFKDDLSFLARPNGIFTGTVVAGALGVASCSGILGVLIVRLKSPADRRSPEGDFETGVRVSVAPFGWGSLPRVVGASSA